MSAVMLRDQHGVVLRYADPAVLRPHHLEQRPHVSDRRRIALLKAECELLTFQIIVEHLELSDIALTRMSDALDAIRVALAVTRRDYGMHHGR